jgi:hypothetical protein
MAEALRQADGDNQAAWVFSLFVLFAIPAFFLITYNSGYGYDQLEYLVIGRSLADGYSLYYWIPSKSFGIYAFVAVLYRLGVSFGHCSDALVITLLFLIMVVATYKVVRAAEGASSGAIAAVLVAFCAVFMELTFLEPEVFVYLFGLAAYYVLVNKPANTASIFLAGLALGAGMDFKSVAAFYAFGAAFFLLLAAFRTDRMTTFFFFWMPALLGGFVVSCGIPALYFALTGRWEPFWRWSVTFPLFNFPRNSIYLYVLYTKLLFIHLIIIGGILVSLRPALRSYIYSDEHAVLALCMGAFSYLALLKTQASHYCFPGAAFFCIFVSIVITKALSLLTRALKLKSWQVGFGGLAAVALVVMSASLYRPGKLKVLFSVRDYAADEGVIERSPLFTVPAGKHVLITAPGADVRWYWLAHRYPPPPFVDMDQKTAWFLRHRPEVVFGGLDDPDLVLVEFNPKDPAMDDPGFGASAEDRVLWERLSKELEKRFVPFHQEPDGKVFWRRASQ